MALSKSFQFSYVESLLRVLTKQVALDDIQSKTLQKIVNKNTLDITEMLNGATAPDYGTVANLSDLGSSVSSTIVTAQNYSNTTRLLGGAVHGFTNADIGRTVVYWVAGTWVVVAQIESISSTTSFVVTKASGTSGAGTVSYSVLPFHSASYLDLSALKVDKIIKVVDNINGLVGPRPDFAFENLAGIDDYDNSVFYNHFGEQLLLFKGSGIAAWGTLTAYYYRLPILISADTDYIDMKDKHIPLLIDKCKLELYELANMLPPKELSQSVESKTQLIRQANDSKMQTIMTKNK